VITKVTRTSEITVGVKNEIGALAKIMSFLVNHGINIEAIAGSSSRTGEEGSLIFITNDNEGAVSELLAHGYEHIGENDVIIIELENRPGRLKNVSELLALNKININYLYCTTCSAGCAAKLVLSTSDNDRAFTLLTS
jgi:hypothetical protein